MKGKFNISRYRELLKKKYRLTKEIFNNPNYFELLSYQGSIYTEIYFSRRNDYCSIIQEYLNATIPSHEFITKFLEMKKEDDANAEKILQDLKKLSSFSIHANVDDFSSQFERMSDCCLQAFEFGHEDNLYGIPEDEFRNSVEEIYFELENYLNEKG